MKCLFCYNNNREKFGKLIWKSIYSIKTEKGLFFYTICPKCKNHTIEEIEKKLIMRRDLFIKKLL